MTMSGIAGAQDAKLEIELGGIAVWDVSHLLPTKGRGYPVRDVRGITHEFVHHSGRAGAEGFEGLYNSAHYVVNRRGFPGCAYHIWLPFEPCRDGEGRLVVFRANQPETRCWHTGGALNGYGESIALQGNTNSRPISDSQRELLEAVLPWRWDAISGYHDPNAEGFAPTLSWHSEGDRWPDPTKPTGHGHAKPACPGKSAVRWLTNYRYSSDWAGDRVVESVS